MEGAALLVVALGAHQVEPLTDRDVVSQKIAGNGFVQGRVAHVHRDHVNYSRTVVYADYEGLDTFQRHEQRQSYGARDGTEPPRPCHPPGSTLAALRLRLPIAVPGDGFLQVP